MNREPTVESNDLPKNKSRVQLLVILLTPLIIMLVSTTLYFSGYLTPKSHSNNGILITPVLSVTDFGLPEPEINSERQWQLIQYSAQCTVSCEARLHEQRQIHIALGKLEERIERVLISEQPVAQHINSKYSKQKFISLPSSQLSPRLKSLVPDLHLQDDPVFVVDPFGNVMLYFTSEHDYRARILDLKKLLKLSTIG